jgi:hypothetical protein
MVDEISKRAITVPTCPRDYDHGEGFVSLFPFLSARPSFDFDRLFLLLILITAFEIRLSFMDGSTPDEMSCVFFSM